MQTTRSIEQRLLNKVERIPGFECWIWTGATDGTYGHGRIFIDGKTLITHRVMYELHNGKIPRELEVRHTCDVAGCICPAHLILGTRKQNMRDMYQRGRNRHSNGSAHWTVRTPDARLRGERNPAARLSDAQIARIRADYANGFTQKSLAVFYGVSQPYISCIVLRKNRSA